MAVKLRLVRMGKRKQPTYRVVAADSRSPRNGRFIEILGTYEPRQEPSVINIDNERALHWLRNGAKPTERVEKLLRITGTWEEFTGKPLEPIVYAVKEVNIGTTETEQEITEEPDSTEASVETTVEEKKESEESEESEEEASEPINEVPPEAVEDNSESNEEDSEDSKENEGED